MGVEIEATDNTYQKLNKMLPADATGAFLSIKELIARFVGGLDPDQAAIISARSTVAVIATIALLLPFYSKYFLAINNRIQILLLVVTFLVWSAYLSQQEWANILVGFSISAFVPLIFGIVMILWTLLISPALSHLIR